MGIPPKLCVKVSLFLGVLLFWTTGCDSDGVSSAGDENTSEVCQDGEDNDSDGLTDCEDDECASLLVCEDEDTSEEAFGTIDTPNPLISVDKTVVSGPGVTNADSLVDGRYHSGSGASFGLPDGDAAWVAIEVGAGPSRLLAIWADTGWNDYDDVSGGAPLAYAIKTSPNSTDGEDGDWEEVVSIDDNPVRTRGHSFSFEDMAWVRFEVSAAQADASGVEVDELALYDISASGDERPEDTWFFMGDSITKMAFERASNLQPFDVQVSELVNGYTPAMISGGIGGTFSYDGEGHIEEWLELNPDFQHIGIAYGTNDAWGDANVDGAGFEGYLREVVEAVLDDGRVPHLARIPYADSGEHNTLPDFNAVIDGLVLEYELPAGPDLYTWFEEKPEELGGDGVHPSPTGLVSVNRLWAEAAAQLYVQ
jgi:acyl-CoA thioesterase-1